MNLPIFFASFQIHIRDGNAERFFSICKNNQIYLQNIQIHNQEYRFHIRQKDYENCERIAEKTGVTIIKRRGLGIYFLILRLWKERYFMSGLLLTFLILYSSSFFIWQIHIQNNYKIADETIRSFLSKKEVYSGCVKSKIDCEQLSQILRDQFDDFIWTSVSLDGTTLTISVKERLQVAEGVKLSKNKNTPYNLISPYKGKIESIVTRQGIPKVKQGSDVKKGQLLVGGNIPIKSDDNTVVDYEYTHASADVWIRHNVHYKDEVSAIQKKFIAKKFPCFAIFLINRNHGFRVHFGKRTTCYQGQTIWHRTRINPLRNNPIKWAVQVTQNGTYQTVKRDKTKQKEILTAHFRNYCQELAKKGVQISTNSVKIDTDGKIATASGELTVIEKCGQLIPAKAKHVKGKTT